MCRHVIRASAISGLSRLKDDKAWPLLRRYAEPGGPWSAWTSLGGWIEAPVSRYNVDGRLEVFGRGSDGAVWHLAETTPCGGWGAWTSLGGWVDAFAVA